MNFSNDINVRHDYFLKNNSRAVNQFLRKYQSSKQDGSKVYGLSQILDETEKSIIMYDNHCPGVENLDMLETMIEYHFKQYLACQILEEIISEKKPPGRKILLLEISKYHVLAAVCLAVIFSSIIIFSVPQISAYEHDIVKPCIFEADIERTFVPFGDEPFIIGGVTDCDRGIGYTQNQKDFVYVRILDINGEVIDDNWKSSTPTTRKEFIIPTKYIFNKMVYREGNSLSYIQTNQEGDKNHKLLFNEYYFYLPKITSIDFNHFGFYQVELTYNNYKNIIWFVTYDPFFQFQLFG